MSKESDVEKYLHEQITTTIKGTTRKWVSPNYVGVPDRIIILPGGRVEFAEVKTLVGKLSPMQHREIERLRDFGCEVVALYGKEGVDSYIKELINRGY